jgi:hypothetical protein
MTNSRDDFSGKTIRILQERVAHRCSNPDCRAPTSGPNTIETKATRIGVAAHITAAAKNGPRYNPNLIPKQRKSIENAIWLCNICSRKIDSDINRYTVDVLFEWKEKAENTAREELGKPNFDLDSINRKLIDIERMFESMNKEPAEIQNVKDKYEKELLILREAIKELREEADKNKTEKALEAFKEGNFSKLRRLYAEINKKNQEKQKDFYSSDLVFKPAGREPERKLVFLSYAHDDLKKVREVYEGLKKRKVNIWFDREDLGLGKWYQQIMRQISLSKYFIFCVSKASILKTGGDKPGFADTELQRAYEIAMTQPDDVFTIIPVRLEDCGHGDHRLSAFQQYELFKDFEKELDRLAVQIGGISLDDAKARDERTEEEKLIDGFKTKGELFYYHRDYENAAKFYEKAFFYILTLIDNYPNISRRLERYPRIENVKDIYFIDELKAEYLNRVLSAARSKKGIDARSESIIYKIKRLSKYQVRLHFIMYYLVRKFFFGHGNNFDIRKESDCAKQEIFMPLTVYEAAMNLTDDEDVNDILLHSIIGLKEHNLIDKNSDFYKAAASHLNKRTNINQNGLLFRPSSSGTELFLWANGIKSASGYDLLMKDFNMDWAGIKIPDGSVPISKYWEVNKRIGLFGGLNKAVSILREFYESGGRILANNGGCWSVLNTETNIVIQDEEFLDILVEKNLLRYCGNYRYEITMNGKNFIKELNKSSFGVKSCFTTF